MKTFTICSHRAQTLIYGVVTPCYQHHHKVPQLHVIQPAPLDYAQCRTEHTIE